MAISIRTKDYRSDIVLTLHMTLGGETVNVPQHDFLLRFFTEHEARHYDCGRIKGEWLHCAPDESDTTVLTCYIKNHGLGCGMLQCLYVDLSPNDGMEDGVQRTFSVSGIDLELVDDASDDTQAVDGSVIVDINAVLTELHNAADAAIASQQKNIASIVYLASDQPGGQNIITITLNDGTVIRGTVLNGKDGNGSDEQDYVKDVKLNGRSVVTNKGVAMIDTEASLLPALVTIDGIRKENVLDALVALNQYISSVEESIDEHGGETELVFGSLNNGIFYDINGNEAVRSASLLYVDRNTGIIYRWGTNSFVVVGKEPMDNTPTSGSQKPMTSDGVYTALQRKQNTLVSGTNIKTVNGNSLLGSGNVTIAAGEDGKSAYQSYVDTTTDSPVKTEAQWIASLKGEDGVGFASASSPSTADGTWQITLTNGDIITIDLNHVHPQYLKHELVQSLPASPDSGTLYLIAAE